MKEEIEAKKRAKLRCMKLLEYADRSEGYLRTRLKEEGFSQEEIDEGIAYVKGYHYLDDARMAEYYVSQTMYKKSPKQIAFDLKKKGIDEEIIKQTLETYADAENEEEAAKYLLKKKAKGKQLTEEKARVSILRYLIGKGFSYELSMRLLREYIEETLQDY